MYQERSVFIGIDAKADSDPLVHLILAEAVYQQRLALPGLRALFFRRSPSDLHQAILSGELDLGLCLSPAPTIDKSFEHCLLSHDEMALILRSDEALPDEPSTVRRLLDRRGLVMTRRELPELSHVVQILNDLGCSPKIRYTEDRTSMLLNIESGVASLSFLGLVSTGCTTPTSKLFPCTRIWPGSICWQYGGAGHLPLSSKSFLRPVKI